MTAITGAVLFPSESKGSGFHASERPQIGLEIFFNFIGLASTELSFCCYTNYDFLAPKRAIQEDLVVK